MSFLEGKLVNLENLKLGIIGLGYVGLPLAVEFGKKLSVVGFDIHQKRIEELRNGQDHTLEVSPEELVQAINLTYSADNGDGETSRDFCFIENTVQANILAATANDEAKNQVYNVAVEDRTALNDLFNAIKAALNENGVTNNKEPVYRDFRAGDVRHSQVSIEKIKNFLGYNPQFVISRGIESAMPWYIKFLGNK